MKDGDRKPQIEGVPQTEQTTEDRDSVLNTIPPQALKRLQAAVNRTQEIVKEEAQKAQRKTESYSPEEWMGIRRKVMRQELDESRKHMSTVVTDGALPLRPEDSADEGRKKQEKREHLQHILVRWQAEGHTEGVEAFYGELVTLDAIQETALQQEMEKSLKKRLKTNLGEKFSDEDTERITSGARQNRELYREHLFQKKLAALAEYGDGGDYKKAEGILLDRTITDVQRQQRLQSVFDASVRSGNVALGAIQVVEQGLMVIDGQQRRRQQQEAMREKISNQLAGAKMQTNFSRLTTEGLVALGSLIDSGGRDLARTLLVSDLRSTPDGCAGRIEREEVHVSGQGESVECYLVHEGAKIPLSIGRFDIGGFNEARLTKAAQQAHSDFFEHPSEMRQSVWERLFGKDSMHFMTAEEADLTQNVLQFLLKDCKDKQEEIDHLKQLHLITEDQEPNSKYLAWWALELRYLLQELPSQQFLQVLKFDHLHYLAEKWHRERKLSLLTFTEIANLLPIAPPRESGPDVGTSDSK